MPSGGRRQIKKKPSTLAQAAGVAKSVVKLGAKVTNPHNQLQSLRKAVKGEGIVLPGSKYIGPGNRMDLGKPKDRGDKTAYKHDQDYDKILKSGGKKKDVYLGYSHADKRALKQAWKDARDGSGSSLAVAAGMGVKALASKSGLTKKYTRRVRSKERELKRATRPMRDGMEED